MVGTPAKLKNGTWGARVTGPAAIGEMVTITTRAGKTWDAVIDRVIWERDGVALCETRSSAPRPAARRRYRSTRTGCQCGSREELDSGALVPSERNCDSCRFDDE